MIGCTIDDFVLVDGSGQSRTIDFPVGQVGWTLSLREEYKDNAYPNSSRTKLILAKKFLVIKIVRLRLVMNLNHSGIRILLILMVTRC